VKLLTECVVVVVVAGDRPVLCGCLERQSRCRRSTAGWSTCVVRWALYVVCLWVVCRSFDVDAASLWVDDVAPGAADVVLTSPHLNDHQNNKQSGYNKKPSCR